MAKIETESPSLDAEDWQIAFKVYRDDPQTALILAQHLSALRNYLMMEPARISTAIEAIGRAIDALYLHTQFQTLGYKLFLQTVEGTISPEQEKMLVLLVTGIKAQS